MDRGWLLGGVLFAGSVGVVRALTYRPKLTKDSSVLLIGDAFAGGMGPHFQALTLENELPYLAAAIPGSRIDQWVASEWLTEKLLELRPTHVLIVLGTTEAYTGDDPDDVADDAQALVEVIRSAGAAPIWIGTPPLPQTYKSAPLDIETTAALRDSVPYYFDSDVDIPRGPDGLHPTAAGYAGWAGLVWSWLS